MPIDLILDQMEIKDNGVYTPIIAAGTPGAVFIPSVSSTGIVSWTNNGGLPNPESVKITGLPSGGFDGQIPVKVGDTDYSVAWQSALPISAQSAPADLGVTASVGESGDYARADHVHKRPTLGELGAAATGLGITGAAVGDLIGINAVSSGSPTGFKAVSPNAVKLNPNLLDNWYFVGGGSQLGYGKFPINQRGQATYSSSYSKTIDRWGPFNQAENTITLLPDGVQISRPANAAGNWTFTQDVESQAALSGKTVTFSILFKNSTAQSFYLILRQEGTVIQSSYSPLFYGNNGLASFTVTLNDSLSLLRVIVGLESIESAESSMTLIAAKLEIGSEQTLAHQENGAWVLNEIPNYSEELTKCRRYYRRYVSNEFHDFCLTGCMTSGKTELLLGLPDGTPMVKRDPRATISGSVIVRGINGYIANPSVESLVARTGHLDGYGTTITIQKSTAEAWTDDDINNTPVQVNLAIGTIIEIYAE